ncbi:M15 family metallopeptidase [Mangrovibacillus cuniculi]|uniref:M15 family metallopeptidase n=1 Tax=Mangrovibacillus cuniculi TaxID=2593652 RepID=A0A7S8CAV7_9BACI|nr:M15 family metallopeptidase [Mangrovibacillus cuniculi]QPC46604.1 M15 family metallopeptidase [Mangrovibacillus cuniculi]
MKKIAVSILTISLLSGCQMVEDKFPNLTNEQTQPEETPTPSTDTDKEVEKEELEKEKEEDIVEDKMLLVNEEKLTKSVEVDGQFVVQNPENAWVLVNKELALPKDYYPEDLVRPSVPFVFGDEEVEKALIREEAAIALEQWFEKAKNENIDILAASGFRSYDRQATIFQATVDTKGEEHAIQAVALPGKSEHQTGLAMDITSPSVNYDLVQEYGDTKEGKWLSETAHEFGFILRYPKDKESITGYMYEPWHFRYVGVELATYLKEKNWTLEEYMNEVQAI